MAVQTRIDERMVVRLWERQQLPAAALAPLRLRVIFRGLPSDAGGPDYQEAVVSVGDKRILTGDIEFHVHSEDWYRHGHHRNPRYNHVILHVVWRDDADETRTEDGSSVPVVALERYDPFSALMTPGVLDDASEPHSCLAAFSALPTNELMDRVQELGSQRFIERAGRFTADLSVEEPDQVTYRALLEGLGYASNRKAFIQLADAIPYGWLHSLPLGERLSSILDAARLGPTAAIPPPAHIPPDSWRLTMLRPANHPIRRLSGLVLLLDRLAPSPATALLEIVTQAARSAELRHVLTVRAGEDTFIGPGRADELAVSVVLPLVAALAPGSERALALFKRYPSPPENRWTRHMTGLLQQAGRDVATVRTAAEHQGLHHLYHSFCRAGNAGSCPVCRVALGPEED